MGRVCGALQRIQGRAVGGRANGQEKAEPGFSSWWNLLQFHGAGRAESQQKILDLEKSVPWSFWNQGERRKG